MVQTFSAKQKELLQLASKFNRYAAYCFLPRLLPSSRLCQSVHGLLLSYALFAFAPVSFSIVREEFASIGYVGDRHHNGLSLPFQFYELNVRFVGVAAIIDVFRYAVGFIQRHGKSSDRRKERMLLALTRCSSGELIILHTFGNSFLNISGDGRH
eukprot:GEMP01112531.1.p1 GENE.GEMP01112531.1~~GEMP01112531.1.p1  ORF type:complete len:165 (-),score=8.27 GEMP01112531.1:183-647(-)